MIARCAKQAPNLESGVRVLVVDETLTIRNGHTRATERHFDESPKSNYDLIDQAGTVGCNLSQKHRIKWKLGEGKP